MTWSVGFDERWRRDIGYGVPAVCDYPGCETVIDRGLDYVCGGAPYGGKHGCGLYFCARHLHLTDDGTLCERCANGQAPFAPKPDAVEWMLHKLRDESWQRWRTENPAEVNRLAAAITEAVEDARRRALQEGA